MGAKGGGGTGAFSRSVLGLGMGSGVRRVVDDRDRRKGT